MPASGSSTRLLTRLGSLPPSSRARPRATPTKGRHPPRHPPPPLSRRGACPCAPRAQSHPPSGRPSAARRTTRTVGGARSRSTCRSGSSTAPTRRAPSRWRKSSTFRRRTSNTTMSTFWIRTLRCTHGWGTRRTRSRATAPWILPPSMWRRRRRWTAGLRTAPWCWSGLAPSPFPSRCTLWGGATPRPEPSRTRTRSASGSSPSSPQRSRRAARPRRKQR
mmetsp:Transcript_22526/g.50919  ORF Transcript_22526/g.50919 Transcript_22526/m.50919 type:complete len:220 (+) Transcript_22526:2498-3157(+)